MAFPSASETGGTNSASTSHDLSLPSFSAGDLIIVKVSGPSNPTHTWTFDSSTSKFTQLWQQDTSVSVSREVCKYRVMQAGDGSTLNIGLSSSRALTYSIIKVTGWHGSQAPEIATTATGYSNNINPPSVTASWGSADNLFIACAMTDSRAITSGTPGSYTAFDNHGSDSNSYQRQAYRQYASASDDPGNFTATGNARYITTTIVVRPGVATEASPGAGSGTGTAYDSGTWASQSAEVASGTGSAGQAEGVGGMFIPAGSASGTGTADAPSAQVTAGPLPASGTGTAHDSAGAAAWSALAECATGTGTAYDRLLSTSATAGAGYGFGDAYLVEPRDARGPLVRPEPLTIVLGSTDISALVVSGISWDSTLGAVPTASVTISDLDGAVAWPLDPGYDPAAPTGGLPELSIAAGATALFSGPVVSWSRERIDASAFVYTLRAEGWQRIFALTPVAPFTSTTSTQEAPDGTVVTADVGYYLGQGTDDGPVTDVSVIIKALLSWAGPTITYDDIPYRVSVSWCMRPRGAPLSAVLDEIADRLGYDDVWWLDADLAFHWRPGLTGGRTAYTGPVEYLAHYRIGDAPDSGVLVPTRLTDSADGGHIREGVYVTGSLPSTNALAIGGPDNAGYDVMSVVSRDPGIPYLLGMSYLADRLVWRRTITAVLPPQPAGAPIPKVGEVVAVEYEDAESPARYYLVRSVRAQAVVTGEGIGDVEWTVELGDSERRSYVYEEAELVEAATKDKAPQVVQLEVAEVNQLMGVDSVQYIIARPVDGAHNRVQLEGGTVHWSIWIDHGDGNDHDIGAGDEPSGWWLTEEDTPVVFEDKDDARRWGYAYCELHCGTNSSTTDVVQLKAELVD